MANWYKQLIARIIEDRDFSIPLIQYGITDVIIRDAESKEIYKFIQRYKLKYKEVPSAKMVQSKFKDYVHEIPIDSMKPICEEVNTESLRSALSKKVRRIIDLSEESPRSCIFEMQQALKELNSYNRSPEDLTIGEYCKTFDAEYELLKSRGGISGIAAYPWPSLNRATGGVHSEDFNVFYGIAKSGKTWYLLVTGLYFVEQGKKVLIITKEMRESLLFKRCVALKAEVPYREFCRATLTSSQLKHVLEVAEELKNNKNFIATKARSSDGGAPSINSVQMKIEEHQPDIVLIDGAYLLQDSRTKVRSVDYKNITHVSQDLKGLAQLFGIPIVATIQANRYGNKESGRYGDIGYSASFAQDTDLLVRFFRDQKENTSAALIKAVREGEETGFELDCKPAESFKEIRAGISSMKKYRIRDNEGIEAAYVSKEEMNEEKEKEAREHEITKDRFISKNN